MTKKTHYIPILLLLVFILGACSSVQTSTKKSTTSQVQQSTLANFSSQPVKNKLAVGILKLEGTDLAVTNTQAQDMLVLWKGIKALSSDAKTAPEEVAAIYDQMQEILSSDQINAIKAIDLTSDELASLKNQYAVQASSKAASSTGKAAQSQNSGVGAQGGPPPDGGIVMGVDAPVASQASASKTKTTTGAAVQSNTNILFVDSVIKLLEQKTTNV